MDEFIIKNEYSMSELWWWLKLYNDFCHQIEMSLTAKKIETNNLHSEYFKL